MSFNYSVFLVWLAACFLSILLTSAEWLLLIKAVDLFCLKLHGLILFACSCLRVLATSKVLSGWVPTCGSANSWRLYSSGRPGHQHLYLISYSVTLSWHWGNQSFLYPYTAECLARKWQASILVVDLIRPGFRPTRFGFPDPPKWETNALLMQPSHLVHEPHDDSVEYADDCRVRRTS